MNQYLLSIMKGRTTGPLALMIIGILWPFSVLYRCVLEGHRSFYHLKGRYKASKPVISIGNITVGGAGKTPLVIGIAEHLKAKGINVAILTRGYMTKASTVSDEVSMLNEQLASVPVLMGANRVNSIKQAAVMPVDVYLCDDAFQHWPLHRDLDIVAIDAANPWGNGHLLPAGILREPLSSLQRADIIVLNKADTSSKVAELYAQLQQINPQALIVESHYRREGFKDVFDGGMVPEDFLKDKPVAAFCGIGDPFSFEAGLTNAGVKIARMFNYMDHHVYTSQDIEMMVDYCRSEGIEVLVTTHKDAVKLRSFRYLLGDIKLMYVSIRLEITKGSDEFIQKIISICSH